mmetsp:Transcript_36980/g.85326  ORF Transcript_36980/g.85326 Transcript_36980/m.85326 type:complete len:117 (-) Transcript_36980:61-411(-)
MQRLLSCWLWMGMLLSVAHSISIPVPQQEQSQAEALIDASLSFLLLGGNASAATHARFASAANSSSPLALIAATMSGVTCQDKVMWIAAAGVIAGAVVSLTVCAEWRKNPPEGPTI